MIAPTAAATISPRTLIVVPAYNESAALPGTLDTLDRSFAATGNVQVVVVDDGSTDGTADVARRNGATVVALPYNLGVGGAVRTGLRYAVEAGADRVVVLDADGQHAAEDVAALLAPLDDGVSMVIGSRFANEAGYEMGVVRRFAQRGLNGLVRLATGFPATDATSGFRAFDREVARFLAERYPVEYLADTVEVIVLVRRAGFTIAEVPTHMNQRQAGHASTRSFGLVFNYVRLLVGVIGVLTVPRSKREHR